MKAQFLVTSRPFINKGTLTSFAAVALTITTKTKRVVTIFVGMNRETKMFALRIFA
ncbi:hypothetical protein JCM19239_4386 [Vibrio variabilis]|uniref:Uncharacterized protein n=1 Tax=Vibrio variabilis TaxID=990271 RepID=A0ABQ0JE53_9VIBR|nr:hypothetical protein JCM19239_4386 [Vibrio variabilis]